MAELKEWRGVSASQIKTFRRCPSKWWLEKIAGLASPPGKAAILGQKLHKELEQWLSSERRLASVDSRVRCAITAKDSPLPHPGRDDIDPDNIERRFKTVHDRLLVPMRGVIDLCEPEHNRITDHKTTSDMDAYGKSEEELKTDPQAIIYCHHAVQELGYQTPLTFRHIYYSSRQDKPARFKIVDAILTEQEIEEGWAEIENTVVEMAKASRDTVVGQVGHNLTACGDYGGCPFRQQCAEAGRKTLGALSGLFATSNTDKSTNNGEKKMGLYDDLLKTKRAKADARAATPTKETPDARKEREWKEQLAKESCAVEGCKAPVTHYCQDDQGRGIMCGAALCAKHSHADHAVATKTLGPQDLNPPDGVPEMVKVEIPKGKADKWTRTPLEEIQTVEQIHEWAQNGRPEKYKKTEIVQVAQRLLGLTGDVSAIRMRDQKKDLIESVRIVAERFLGKIQPLMTPAEREDLGEPPHEPDESTLMVSVKKTQVVEPPEQEAVVESTEPETVVDQLRALGESLEEIANLEPIPSVLYINCLPRQGARPVRLSTLLLPLCQEVEEHQKVPHYGMVKFAQGPKMVAALAQRMDIPTRLYADRRDPLTDAVLEVITHKFDLVVESVG